MKLCKCGQIVKDRCLRCSPVKAHGGTTKERGYGSDHKRASVLFRTLHPLCERCVMLVGVLEANPSEELHHISSIVLNRNNRMNPNNWLSLCRPCHEEIEEDTAQGFAVRRWSDNHYEDRING